MIKLISFSVFILMSLVALTQPAGYNYGKQVLVDGTKVSGAIDLIDFTMLVSFVDPNLRTVANGGHVENNNGYDIIFTFAECGVTVLKHQIEKYNPVTGEYIAWVKVNKLNATSNTNIHMYYGNSSVNTDPSSPQTWNSNVAAVYHLSNNDFSDGTSNGMNGVNHSTGNIAGKIGDARSISNSYINVAESGATSLDVTTLTMSAWIYPTDYNVVSDRGIIVNKEGIYEMGLRDNVGSIQAASTPGCWRWAGTEVIGLNTWSKVTVVYSTGKQRHYVNGVWIEDFNDCSNPLNSNDSDMRIGARGGDSYPSGYFKGSIDEVKISNREETADWIKTEYVNQNNPASFYTVSAEMTASALCIALPIELKSFEATLVEDKVLLNWSTISETDNDYFEIQRSGDGLNWTIINKTEGAGNSVSEIKYHATDLYPLQKTSYYRLKQVDFNGNYSFSSIQKIDYKNDFEDLKVYPNPAQNYIVVELEAINTYQLVVYNSVGKKIQLSNIPLADNQAKIDVSNLVSGFYFLEIVKNKGDLKKVVKFSK